jgi:hypothetical protein
MTGQPAHCAPCQPEQGGGPERKYLKKTAPLQILDLLKQTKVVARLGSLILLRDAFRLGQTCRSLAAWFCIVNSPPQEQEANSR